MSLQNVPGPDGYNRIYRAAPDGYTIGLGDIVGHIVLGELQPLPFDLSEVTVLGRFNAGVHVLVAGDHTGIKTLEDLKRVGKEKTLRYAGFGFNLNTIQTVVLAEKLGIKVVQVDFDGPRATVAPTVRGDADLGLLGPWQFYDEIEAGMVHPLVVFSPERSAVLPDVPTMREIGLPELESLMHHRGIFGPPDMPDTVRDTLVNAFKKVMASEEMVAELEKAKFETDSMWHPEILGPMDEVKELVGQYTDVFKAFTK